MRLWNQGKNVSGKIRAGDFCPPAPHLQPYLTSSLSPCPCFARSHHHPQASSAAEQLHPVQSKAAETLSWAWVMRHRLLCCSIPNNCMWHLPWNGSIASVSRAATPSWLLHLYFRAPSALRAAIPCCISPFPTHAPLFFFDLLPGFCWKPLHPSPSLFFSASRGGREWFFSVRQFRWHLSWPGLSPVVKQKKANPKLKSQDPSLTTLHLLCSTCAHAVLSIGSQAAAPCFLDHEDQGEWKSFPLFCSALTQGCSNRSFGYPQARQHPQRAGRWWFSSPHFQDALEEDPRLLQYFSSLGTAVMPRALEAGWCFLVANYYIFQGLTILCSWSILSSASWWTRWRKGHFCSFASGISLGYQINVLYPGEGQLGLHEGWLPAGGSRRV